MTRIRSALIPLYIIAAACGLSGCSRRVPSATVVLVDPSGSVTLRARKDEFAAVATLIPRMRRGDLLTIIPITDNAVADIEGRVLRLRAPNRREAYDADLRRFQTDPGKRYAAFASNLLAHPGQRTDILGALDVARQELEEIPARDQRQMIVLSDFLEDDGAYRFTSDPRLRDLREARQLAGVLVRDHGFALFGTSVHLGMLRSNDSAGLPIERERAVSAFWERYLAQAPTSPEILLDGTGSLP